MGEVRTGGTSNLGLLTTIERKKGSDADGNSGNTNRKLTLAQAPNNLLVHLNGQLLTLTEDYTVSGADVTFLGAIDNDDFITAHYEG